MKKIPFPQANNMDLIFNIFFDIGENGLSKYDVIKKYQLADRQGAYYLDALLYIGVVEKIKIKYFLNNIGINIRLKSIDEIKKSFCKQILSNPFINDMYISCKEMNSISVKKNYIAGCIFNKIGLNLNTSHRRASTILNWFEWIDIHGRD